MKKIALIILILFNANFLFAQDQPWFLMMQDPNVNFYDVQQAFNKAWKDKTPGKGQGYKQFKRWENFMEPRVYPTGKLPHEIIDAELRKVIHDASFPKQNRSLFAANWQPLGPTTVPANGLGYASAGIGRVNCVRFDPTNSNIIWIGTPGGGLWKSIDGGGSWTNIPTTTASLGISDIAIHPTNSNIIYVATGDADASDTYSVGILKSIDGGATWTVVGLQKVPSNYFRIARLIINPVNPDIILAATNSGLYRTTTGGGTFTAVIASGIFYDAEFKPGDPNIVYAASYSSGGTGKCYYSTNGGSSFNIATGIPSSDVMRISIAVTPADPTVVYALIANATNSGYKGLYKSTNSGQSYSLVHSTPNILSGDETGSGTGGQGWYDLALAVSPLDANLIYVGGINIWKSTNGGSTFSITGHWYAGGTGTLPFVHADQHNFDFLPNSNTIFSCNDGGLRKSTNNGSSWTDLSNGLQITQFYRLSGAATNANIIYAGAQDNGTNRLSSGAWSSVYGGDGMKCLVDHTNANKVYVSYQFGNLFRSTNGGSSFVDIKPAGSPDGAWITPYVIHPTTTTTLYAGYTEIYKSTNSGTSWTTVTSNLSAGAEYTSMAIAPSNGDYVYAATNNKLFKTTNGGTTWSNITSGLPVASASITYITVSSANPNQLYVTFSGYSASNKIFMSTNGGSSWTNISTGLPNAPVNCVAYQTAAEDALYVGTDIGVYYKNNSTAWTYYNTNMPAVSVRELDIHYATSKIRAATFGRGIWESDLANVVTVQIPIANFTANQTTINAGQSINFTDQSTNTPTNWTWTFTGGNPSTSSSQNPTVSYVNPGTYTVKLKVSNTAGVDSLIKLSYITVNSNSTSNCVTWNTQATGFTTASRGIRHVEIVNSNVAWAVAYDGSGSNAVIRDYTRTIDAGQTWVPGNIPIASSYAIANITSSHQDTAWASLFPNTATVAAQGVYQTTNGGTTWTRQSTASYNTASSFINFVHFFNGNDGVAQGDPAGGYFEIYTTNNGGTTWTRVNSANIPAPIAADEYGTIGYFTASGNSIWFLTTKGRIFRSADKGATWAVASTPLGTSVTLTNIAFKNATNGLLTGVDLNSVDIGIYQTTDAGATWSLLTTNTAGIGNKSGLTYVPGTTGTYYVSGANTTAGAGSAYSTDNGATWTSIDAIQHTSIDFFSETVGWSGSFNTSSTVGGMFKIGNSSLSAVINPPAKDTFCVGETVSLSTTANVNYTYQWYLGGSIISGANSNTYNATQAGLYTVEISEGSCTTISSPVELFTVPSPNKPTVQGNNTICQGETTILTASTASNYQWYKNGSPISNATQNTLQVTEAGAYTVEVKNVQNCSAVSNPLNVQVLNYPPKPMVSLTGPTEFCEGGEVTLISNATTLNKWYKDGVEIPSANQITYTAVQSGKYHVTTSAAPNLCVVSSDTIEVEVFPTPTKPTITRDSLTLTSSIANAYQWYKDDLSLVDDTLQTYVVTESGSYKVEIFDSLGCSAISDTMHVVLVGLNEGKLINELSIYPNPSKGQFTLKYTLNEVTEVNINVINVLGQVTQEIILEGVQSKGKYEMPIEQNGAGVYVLQIKTKQGIREMKFVVQ